MSDSQISTPATDEFKKPSWFMVVMDKLIPVWALLIFFLLWELIERATGFPPDFIIPLPSDIFGYIINRAAFLGEHLLVTLIEAALGFLLGNLLAVILAVASVFSAKAERVIMPFALALRSIPIIAITPVIIFILGFGMESKVAVATIITFFPMLVNLTVGLKSVDHRLMELLYVLNANKWQTLMRVRLPSSMPSFFAALKIAVPSSILGAAVAEWINASAGIGYLIIISTYQFDTLMLYATMFVSTAVSAAAYLSVIGLEGVLLPWKKMAGTGVDE
jgi:NitT/TauT family transport system permease protein